MREWWARLTPEEKRAKTGRRDPARVAEQARRKQQLRRRYGTAEQKQRINARGAVNVAVHRGRLSRGVCEVCGGTENVEAHHEDHGRPLDVEWLCREHHHERHGVPYYGGGGVNA
jgi:hypothetical protein